MCQTLPTPVVDDQAFGNFLADLGFQKIAAQEDILVYELKPEFDRKDSMFILEKQGNDICTMLRGIASQPKTLRPR